jgi:hypothetical protein
MLFLATFFPAATDDDDDISSFDKEVPFDFVTVNLSS